MLEWIKTIDIATIVLMGIMGMGLWVLWKVQRNDNDFDFKDMLRDENGKPSAFRLAVFVALAVSTWIIMYIVLNTKSLDTWMYVSYLAIWSGSKIAESAVQAYGGQGRYGGYRSNRSSQGYRGDEEGLSDEPVRRRYTPP